MRSETIGYLIPGLEGSARTRAIDIAWNSLCDALNGHPDEARFASSPKEGVLAVLVPVIVAERDAQPLAILAPYLAKKQLLAIANVANTKPSFVRDYLLSAILCGSEAVHESEIGRIEHPYWRLVTEARRQSDRPLNDFAVKYLDCVDLQPSPDFKAKALVQISDLSSDDIAVPLLTTALEHAKAAEGERFLGVLVEQMGPRLRRASETSRKSIISKMFETIDVFSLPEEAIGAIAKFIDISELRKAAEQIRALKSRRSSAEVFPVIQRKRQSTDVSSLLTRPCPEALVRIMLTLSSELAVAAERPRPDADFAAEAERYVKHFGKERVHGAREAWASMLANTRWQEDVQDVAQCLIYLSDQLPLDLVDEAIASCKRIPIPWLKAIAMLAFVVRAGRSLRPALLTEIMNTSTEDRSPRESSIEKLAEIIVPGDFPTILDVWHAALRRVSLDGHGVVIACARTLLPLLSRMSEEDVRAQLNEATSQILNWWRPIGNQSSSTHEQEPMEVDGEAEDREIAHEAESVLFSSERALSTLTLALCQRKDLFHAKALFSQLSDLPRCGPQRLMECAIKLSEACVEEGDFLAAHKINQRALSLLSNAIDDPETRMAWIGVAHCLMFQCVNGKNTDSTVSDLLEKIYSLVKKYGEDERFLGAAMEAQRSIRGIMEERDALPCQTNRADIGSRAAGASIDIGPKAIDALRRAGLRFEVPGGFSLIKSKKMPVEVICAMAANDVPLEMHVILRGTTNRSLEEEFADMLAVVSTRFTSLSPFSPAAVTSEYGADEGGVIQFLPEARYCSRARGMALLLRAQDLGSVCVLLLSGDGERVSARLKEAFYALRYARKDDPPLEHI